ncbi:conjugal transfer protein TraB, partial [Streptomyces albidoflavus]
MSSDEIKSDDNGYQDIQAKLTKLSKALDDKAVELEALRRRMQTNAKKAEDTAKAIENGDLDPRFVEMTFAVATALGGEAVQIRQLIEDADASAAHSR